MNYTMTTKRYSGPSRDFLGRPLLYEESISLWVKVKWAGIGIALGILLGAML